MDFYKKTSVWEKKGSTLVELLVSMTLLLTVILPAGMFLGYMAHFPVNKDRILAFTEAHSALEELLHSDSFTEGTVTQSLGAGRKLEKMQRINEGWVYLQVTVYKKEKALVSLNTSRLVNDEK